MIERRFMFLGRSGAGVSAAGGVGGESSWLLALRALRVHVMNTEDIVRRIGRVVKLCNVLCRS